MNEIIIIPGEISIPCISIIEREARVKSFENSNMLKPNDHIAHIYSQWLSLVVIIILIN